MAVKSLTGLVCLLFCIFVGIVVAVDEENIVEPNKAHIELLNSGAEQSWPDSEVNENDSGDLSSVESREMMIPDTDIPKEGGKFCHSDDLRSTLHYIVGFEPLPESPDVSEISLYGCPQEPFSQEEEWTCDPEDIEGICNGPRIMLYQWKEDGCHNYLARGELITTGGPYINKVVLVVTYDKGGYKNSSGLLLKLLPSSYKGTPGVSEIVDYYSSVFNYKSKCPEDNPQPADNDDDEENVEIDENDASEEEDASDDGVYADEDDATQESFDDESYFQSNDNSEKLAEYSYYAGHVASLAESEEVQYDYSSIDNILNYLKAYWAAPHRVKYTALQTAGYWPQDNIPIGQISGVDMDLLGNLVLFRRGERTWGPDDFDDNNVYTHYNPIQSLTVITVDTANGKIVDAWGGGSFYLPHGLTIDHMGNTWLTDVALHQVFKFLPGSHIPSLTLGEAFVPGDDDDHFCKPTDVAICPKTGDIFVADGYCNNRIVKFASNGSRLFEITAHNEGKTDARLQKFRIPHSLAIIESRGWICVADRENVRIQCFNVTDGAFVTEFKSPQFGDEVFAIAYNAKEDVLYAINGPSMNPSRPTSGFTMSLESGDIIDKWMPSKRGFRVPHDIAVSETDGVVYVADIGLNRIYRFTESDDVLNNMPLF